MAVDKEAISLSRVYSYDSKGSHEPLHSFVGSALVLRLGIVLVLWLGLGSVSC